MVINDLGMFGQFSDPLIGQWQAEAATGFCANRPGHRRRDDTGLALNRGMNRRVGVGGLVVPVHAIPLPDRQGWLDRPGRFRSRRSFGLVSGLMVAARARRSGARDLPVDHFRLDHDASW
jgi:hypothetical protein